MENAETCNKFERLYDKHYKPLLIIPILLLVFSFAYMFHFYSIHNDFITKDISLTGGTSVMINKNIDLDDLKQKLSGKLDGLNTREISDLTSGERKAVIIETKTHSDETKKILEDYLGYELNETNSSFEFTGALLSSNFYNQLLIAILTSFILMSIVIFIIFRNFVPSITVISCAFADILMTLVTVNMMGMQISSAGIIAFLMLIGYSVDTDILLTVRMLKRDEGSINKRIFGAFKTGMTMTVAAIVSVFSALLIVSSFSSTLSQIFTIVSIGLLFDILNTWITNASVIKFYLEHKK